MRRRGITKVEVLVIIGIIALLISIILPSIRRLRATSGRTVCGSNLRMIGQAILLYYNDNNGAYPRTVNEPDVPVTWGTGAAAANPFTSADRPVANDVTAAMFLLLRTQDIASSVFICDYSEGKADRFGGRKNTAQNRSNFTDWRKNCTYAFANPYPDAKAVEAGYVLDKNCTAEFAVAADIGPGIGDGFDVTAVTLSSGQKDMERANSRNHSGSGQNVLYGDGHVEWQQNPFCGTKRDHIYTVSGSTDGSVETSKTVVGSPRWKGDSVLLPPYK